jgi:hypothetical protein
MVALVVAAALGACGSSGGEASTTTTEATNSLPQFRAEVEELRTHAVAVLTAVEARDWPEAADACFALDGWLARAEVKAWNVDGGVQRRWDQLLALAGDMHERCPANGPPSAAELDPFLDTAESFSNRLLALAEEVSG